MRNTRIKEDDSETMKRSRVYGLRFDEQTYALIRQVAERRGMDLADLLREMVRTELARLSYLSPADKKALGVGVNDH